MSRLKITAPQNIYLVLVCKITGPPKMLAINKKLRSEDDMIHIVQTYFSRSRIDEYFRCKKQTYQFENFRVRRLETIIKVISFYITLSIAL